MGWKEMTEPVLLDGEPESPVFGNGGLLDTKGKQPVAYSYSAGGVGAESVTGVCRMPDGSIHPYSDAGGGYGHIYDSDSEASGAGVGQAGNGTAMKTQTKRGGIGGGGKSGDATSRASRAGRNLTGGARVGALKPITGTPSVGGSIGRALPFLGTGLMLYDFMRLSQAPNCQPIADDDRLY